MTERIEIKKVGDFANGEDYRITSMKNISCIEVDGMVFGIGDYITKKHLDDIANTWVKDGDDVKRELSLKA
jgi:hypothetical protein